MTATITRRALLTAAACAAAVLAWQFLTVTHNYRGNWTGLFCAGDAWNLPPELLPGTWRFKNFGYDGQFYRLVAHDPLFKKGYWRHIDDPRLRYGRILYPAAAHLLALGNPRFIDGACIAVVLVSVFLGVYWTGRAFALRGRSPAWGAVFLLVPATLASIDRMLTDSTLTALFAGFLLYAHTGEKRKLYAVLLAAPLTRETGFLLVAGLALHELWRRRYRAAALFATAAIPAVIWNLFVASRTDPSHITRLIDYPVIGLFMRFGWFHHYPLESWKLAAMHALDVVSILGLLASLAAALWWVRRTGVGRVESVVLLFVAMALALGSQYYLTSAYAWARPLSPLLLYLVWQAVVERRWALAAPVAAVTVPIAPYLLHQAIGVMGGVLGLH